MQQEEQGKSVQNITPILRNLIPLFGKSLHTFYAGIGCPNRQIMTQGN